MKGESEMTRQEFISWAESRDYINTGRGTKNIRMISSDGSRSFKISKIAVRYEVKTSNNTGWIKLYSAYLKDLLISEEGKVGGFSR